VASDFCTWRQRGVSFPDPLHHWTVAPGLAQSRSTRISLSALRTVKCRLATRALELSVLGGTFSLAAHSGVDLVRGLWLVSLSLWRMYVGAAKAFLNSRRPSGPSQ
jgi:hypothetical protein